MIDRPRRVVLLIDYDNLQICASRDTPGRDLQLTPVVQLAQRYGTVILARAYAEWNLSTERLAVYKAGIEPAFAPVLRTESDRSGKSLADTVMVAEGMDMLWTLSPDVVVLATSDKDLIPLVRVAKQRGAFVVVLGSDFTAIPLREMADEHFTYRGLITETAGRYATEAGPGRQPAALPEPSRRRTRERTGRERTISATPTVAPTTPARETPAREMPARDVPARETPAAPVAASAAPAPTPAPAATPAAAPGSPPTDPVAPAATGDAEAGGLGRRRRRRGSRRRSDRLGQTADAGQMIEPGATFESDNGEDDEPDDDNAELSVADVVQASNGTVEVEEVPTAEAEAEAAALEAVADAPPELTATAEPVETPAEVSAAPVRERRRRTTRRTAAAPDAEATAPEAAPATDTTPPDVSAAAPAESEPRADAAAPGEAAADGAAADGEGADGGEAAAPARRPRRVASATRGRTRPVSR